MTRREDDKRPGGLQRDAGVAGLLFASLGGIVGSGWLFGPLNAAKVAGPAALVAWAIGGIAVTLLALVYAELTSAFPRAGAAIALPKLSHGKLLATVMSWVVLLGYLTSAPAEATAIVTYANNYVAGLVGPAGVLTFEGFLVAAGLLAVFALINTLAVRLVLRINSVVTIWKLAVPAVTVIALVIASFHPANFTAHGFAPGGLAGIFSAVATSGVIYAYTGFRQSIELAGESRRPKRDLPIAIIGSVLIGFLLYAALQIALIGAIRPDRLANGWDTLSFTGLSGPFAGLASLLGMGWLAVLLYVDSAISPAGTAIIAYTSTPRLFFAVGNEGLARASIARVSRAGVPLVAVGITFAIGILFLLPLPSWRAVMRVVSAAALLSYGMAAVTLVTLRRTLPPAEHPRPFHLAAGVPLATIAFIIANFIIVWTGAITLDVVMAYVVIVAVLFAINERVRHGGFAHLERAETWWLLPYFAGLWALANLGPANLTHGDGLLSNLTLSLLIALFSVAILVVAARAGLADPAEAKVSLATHHGSTRAAIGERPAFPAAVDAPEL